MVCVLAPVSCGGGRDIFLRLEEFKALSLSSWFLFPLLLPHILHGLDCGGRHFLMDRPCFVRLPTECQRMVTGDFYKITSQLLTSSELSHHAPVK